MLLSFCKLDVELNSIHFLFIPSLIRLSSYAITKNYHKNHVRFDWNPGANSLKAINVSK